MRLSIGRLNGTVCAAVLALALAGGMQDALAGKADNTIAVAIQSDMVTFDAANGTHGSDIPILYAMYDRLFDFNPEDMTLRPMLATEWSWSEDQKTLIIQLREDVKFHDGTAMDAAAVKASLDYFKESGTNLDLNQVTNVEVTGPYEVRVTSAVVNSSLPGLLAERAGMILSPTNIELHGKDGYGQNPVGTGPYKFKNHMVGSSITVERFDEYWNPEDQHLDGIEFRIIRNATSAVSAVMTGQLDYVATVDPVNIPALERNPNVRVAVEPMLGFGIIHVNPGVAPMDDKRVRQAFSLSIDREVLAKAVYGVVETKANVLPVPQGYWPSTDSIQENYKYDPERAKELLAEAGHPDGVTMPFCVNANENMPQPALKVMDIITPQLAAGGIKLEVQQMANTAACVDLFVTQKVVPAFLVGWSGRPDPAITYDQMLSSSSFYNSSKTVHGNADELLAELKATFDQEAQKKIYDQLNEVYVDSLPMISLYSYINPVVYANGLVGERPNLLGRPYVRVLRWEN